MSELPPFSCVATPDFIRVLHELRSSIVISTYQAGKVIFLSPKNDRELIQFPGQAKNYPKKPGVYDTLFIPRATYYTGELDIHDIHFTNSGLIAVNTRFSCVSTIDDNFSFTEIWRPSFITELQPGDYCHLNGMVVVNDRPKYLTALGSTNSAKGWRPVKANGGLLIDVDSTEFILSGLPMPRSPRLYKEGLFVLLSATGELARVDIAKQSYEVVYSFNGFVRGMDRVGDLLFIGLSKLRTTSASFGDLPIAAHSPSCGVAVFHLPSGKLKAGLLKNNEVELLGSYKLNFHKYIVSFGMQFGFLNSTYQYDKATLQNPQDPAFNNGNARYSWPNVGVGAIIKGEDFIIGVSVPRLTKAKADSSNFLVQSQHVYVYGAYVYYLGTRLRVKPSILFRATKAAIATDVNFNINIDTKYSAGVFLRNFKSYGVLLQAWAFDKFRFGYAFELPTVLR